MSLLPGREMILQECLEVCALAQTRFVSHRNLTTLPYLQTSVEAHAGQLLIEKLLALAIKVRFLDDQLGTLRQKDRRTLTIGRYFEDGIPVDDVVCIRHALNKLIHHKTIAVSVDQSTVEVYSTSAPTVEPRGIPSGSHNRESVIVTIEGRHGSHWRYDLDLFALLNEVVRVLE